MCVCVCVRERERERDGKESKTKVLWTMYRVVYLFKSNKVVVIMKEVNVDKIEKSATSWRMCQLCVWMNVLLCEHKGEHHVAYTQHACACIC